MDKFDYQCVSGLVNNMEYEATEMEVFPVLIGNEIAHFHEVRGGYNARRSMDIVNLIHRVQGDGSPDRVGRADSVEVHLDRYYWLDVAERRTIDDYPDEDYVVSLAVENYMSGEYSFSEAMTADIDRRNREFKSNNE